jgi:hypothetical protein
MRLESISPTLSATTSEARSPAPCAVANTALYFGAVAARSRRATSSTLSTAVRRSLSLPKTAEPWSLTSPHEKLGHAHPRPRQNRHTDKHVPDDGSVLITAETSPEWTAARYPPVCSAAGAPSVSPASTGWRSCRVLRWVRFGIDDNRAREFFSALLPAGAPKLRQANHINEYHFGVVNRTTHFGADLA